MGPQETEKLVEDKEHCYSDKGQSGSLQNGERFLTNQSSNKELIFKIILKIKTYTSRKQINQFKNGTEISIENSQNRKFNLQRNT